MGRVVEEVVKEYPDLSSLLAALNQNTDKILDSLSSIKNTIASIPFTTPATSTYHYILIESTASVIQPSQTIDVVKQNGSGYLFAAAVIAYGSPRLEITVETSAKGYINRFSETIEDLFYHGFARSSLFKVILYDPVGQIYVMESMPQNFYIWYDDYAKISLRSLAPYQILYSYRAVLAQLEGSS